MRRLGGGKKSSKEKWSHKKKRSSEVSQEEEGNIEGKPCSDNDSTALSKLTSLADSLLVAGEYDVYQLTFEGVKYRIEQEEENEGAYYWDVSFYHCSAVYYSVFSTMHALIFLR